MTLLQVCQKDSDTTVVGVQPRFLDSRLETVLQAYLLNQCVIQQ